MDWNCDNSYWKFDRGVMSSTTREKTPAKFGVFSRVFFNFLVMSKDISNI